MIFKVENRLRLIKLLFSGVIILLLYIAICLYHHTVGTPAPENIPPLYMLPRMLETASAATALCVGAGMTFELLEMLIARY